MKENGKSGSTEPKTAASSPWHATIHKIEVDKWGAAIEDRTLPKPARITIDDLTVRVENLENKKNSKAKSRLALQINQAGTVKVNGSAGIDPLSADLEVLSDKIRLKILPTLCRHGHKCPNRIGHHQFQGAHLIQRQRRPTANPLSGRIEP